MHAELLRGGEPSLAQLALVTERLHMKLVLVEDEASLVRQPAGLNEDGEDQARKKDESPGRELVKLGERGACGSSSWGRNSKEHEDRDGWRAGGVAVGRRAGFEAIFAPKASTNIGKRRRDR
jgi:hypothetical protein